MKVIDQLIGHFLDLGVFDTAAIAYLRQEGLIQDYTDSDDHHADDESPPEDQKIDPEDHPRAPANAARRQPVRKAGRKPRDQRLAAPDIADRLSTRVAASLQAIAAWSDSAGLAPSHSGSTAWRHAAADLRTLSVPRAVQLLQRDPRNLLKQLLAVIDAEPYRRFVAALPQGQPASNALRAILRVPERNALGKYAWALRHPEFVGVMDLLALERQIHLTLGRAYEHCFNHDDYTGVAPRAFPCGEKTVRALTLLHNILRHEKGLFRNRFEVLPRSPAIPMFDTGDAWLAIWSKAGYNAAWESALRMRPAGVRLLAMCSGRIVEQDCGVFLAWRGRPLDLVNVPWYPNQWWLEAAMEAQR